MSPQTPERPYGYDVLDEYEAAYRGLGLTLKPDEDFPTTKVKYDMGRIRIAGTTLDIPAAYEIVPPNNTTTYFYVDSTGAVQTNQTGFPYDAVVLMGSVTMASGLITNLTRNLSNHLQRGGATPYYDFLLRNSPVAFGAYAVPTYRTGTNIITNVTYYRTSDNLRIKSKDYTFTGNVCTQIHIRVYSGADGTTVVRESYVTPTIAGNRITNVAWTSAP